MVSKSVDTLVPDIYELVTKRTYEGTGEWMGERMGGHIVDMVKQPKERGPAPDLALHASKIGKNCIRQMWYSQWHPALAEPLLPHTLIKFTYGDVVEEMALDLARAAGHKVVLEQQRVEFEAHGFTVSGRIDAVIDGAIVDVKSTSPYSFNDWSGKELTAENDSFGYRWQLHTYARGLKDNPEVTDTQRGYLLLMDKQNGHMGLSWVEYNWPAYDLRLKIITEPLKNPTVTPVRNFKPTEKDKMGNDKLPLECSYCDYKRECWKEHDVKAVLRSGRVTWLVAPTEKGKVKLRPGELELGK
jgi:hypothetical protein